MSLSGTQYVDMGQAAMQALVSCHDSILLTPDEIAVKAWALAEAMARNMPRGGTLGLNPSSSNLADIPVRRRTP